MLNLIHRLTVKRSMQKFVQFVGNKLMSRRGEMAPVKQQIVILGVKKWLSQVEIADRILRCGLPKKSGFKCVSLLMIAGQSNNYQTGISLPAIGVHLRN